MPQGIKTVTGETIELDAIVCATGFDYSWIPRFPVKGRNNSTIGDLWKNRPTAYFGLAVNDIPNYFGKYETWTAFFCMLTNYK